MAFSLKNAFKKVGEVLKEAFSIEQRDMPTMSDDFAKAAFAKQGFVVQSRESFKEFESEASFQVPTEATYLLKKANDDGKSYVGTVTAGYITLPAEMAFHGRYHAVTGIKPK